MKNYNLPEWIVKAAQAYISKNPDKDYDSYIEGAFLVYESLKEEGTIWKKDHERIVRDKVRIERDRRLKCEKCGKEE